MEASFTELWWSLRTVEELVVQAVRSKGLETTHTLWQWSSSKCHPGGTTSLIKCWAYLFLHPWTCRLQKEPLCQKEVLFHHTRVHQFSWSLVFWLSIKLSTNSLMPLPRHSPLSWGGLACQDVAHSRSRWCCGGSDNIRTSADEALPLLLCCRSLSV